MRVFWLIHYFLNFCKAIKNKKKSTSLSYPKYMSDLHIPLKIAELLGHAYVF
jgi:hypothetical protein